jgi:hypothetical protein
MEKTDTFDKVDNMLIECGKVASFIQIACSVICILCLCGFGIFFFRKKNNRIKTNATILNTDCRSYSVDTKRTSRMRTDCILDIEYRVNGVMKQAKISTNDKIHYKGEIIEINYDEKNPLDIAYNQISSKTIGKTLIGLGMCVVILMIIHIILMKKSNWYKRIMCVNLVGSAFSGSSPGIGDINL